MIGKIIQLLSVLTTEVNTHTGVAENSWKFGCFYYIDCHDGFMGIHLSLNSSDCIRQVHSVLKSNILP